MINLHQAVIALYPNAVVVKGNDVNFLSAEDSDGLAIAIVPNEVMTKLAELQAAEAKAEQAQATAKASALDKLTKLGLTADEIKALLQ